MKEVLPRLSLAGNLEKPLMALYGTEWRGTAMDSAKKSAKSKNRVYSLWGPWAQHIIS
jgi:hypothetical protein